MDYGNFGGEYGGFGDGNGAGQGGYENGYNGYGNGGKVGAGGGWMPDPGYEKRVIRGARKSFSRIGLIYMGFLAVSLVSQYLVMMILSLTGLSERLNWNLCMLISMLGMYPAAVPLTWLLMEKVPKVGRPGDERWGLGKLAGFFVFSMGVLYAGNIIGTVLMAMAGIIKGEPIANDMQEMIMSMDTWTIMAAAVTAAPIIEELVFRKFLLDRIAGYGHWTAMIVSGVLFGVAHGNFYQFFYAFGLGVIFAYVYLHTGKIVYTIIFHMLINFCGSILPMGILKIAEASQVIGGLLSIGEIMMMFAFMICGVVLLVCCWRDLYFDRGITGISPAKKAQAAWLNVGMVLFLVWGAVSFALSL